MSDPYKVKTAVVRSCGNQVFPRGSVTSLPGGGKAYAYPGAGLTFTVPPAHFDPLKTSDRRLSEYGYPTRHQLGASRYGVVRHMRHPVVPPPYLVVLPRVHAPAPRHGPAPLTTEINSIANAFTGNAMAGPSDFISSGSNFNMKFYACK